MKKIFKGRIYFGNTWPFYLLFIGLLILGLWISPKIGFWITMLFALALPWMLIANLNIFKWYSVDEEGISLIRFWFTFKKFYFKDIISIEKLSSEETKELLYKEYAPTLMFRRAPMENPANLLEKVPEAYQISKDLIELIRYSSVSIVKIGHGTGYQYPTVEDAKKTFSFKIDGSFILITNSENKYILISPDAIDEFLDYSKSFMVK